MYQHAVVHLEDFFQLVCFDRIAQLGHRTRFDLPYALSSYIELLAWMDKFMHG